MKFDRPVIDGHMHLYKFFDDNGTSIFKLFDNIQENTGLNGMSIACLTDKLYGSVTQNIMGAFYKLQNPTVYAKAGIVYPNFPVCPPLPAGMESDTQYKELAEIGFDGFKILYKPDCRKATKLPINDGYYEPFFALAEKDGAHFTWHVADPDFFWKVERNSSWCYTDGTYPTFREIFEQVFDVMEKHPKLNVSFAHFLFMSEHTDVLEYIFDRYENVSIDVTPGTEMYVNFSKKRDFYRDFLEKHADRILFGTDAELPDNPESEKLIRSVYDALTTDKTVDIWGAEVTGLKLSDEACDKILYRNYMRVSGSAPKKVCVPALLKYIDKYEHLIDDSDKKTVMEYADRLAAK